MAERMVEANGVELCTESFGRPADPPVLLIMGIGASMLWWEEGFCRLLADGGRFVIRYDHRDTGRSVTYEPGRPCYTGADLVADAAGVLDAYGLAPELPPGADTDRLVALMARDKKAIDGLTFVLDGPRGVEVVSGVPRAPVEAALARMGA